MQNSDKLESFNQWLFDMDDALDAFFKIVPAELVGKLDYSVASLDILENWLLEKYARFSETQNEEANDSLDKAARYTGETFLKNIGGHWDIILDDEKNVFYNLPVITGYKEKPTPYCPLALCTASVDRRTGNFISSILDRAIEKIKKPHS